MRPLYCALHWAMQGVMRTMANNKHYSPTGQLRTWRCREAKLLGQCYRPRLEIYGIRT